MVEVMKQAISYVPGASVASKAARFPGATSSMWPARFCNSVDSSTAWPADFCASKDYNHELWVYPQNQPQLPVLRRPAGVVRAAARGWWPVITPTGARTNRPQTAPRLPASP